MRRKVLIRIQILGLENILCSSLAQRLICFLIIIASLQMKTGQLILCFKTAKQLRYLELQKSEIFGACKDLFDVFCAEKPVGLLVMCRCPLLPERGFLYLQSLQEVADSITQAIWTFLPEERTNSSNHQGFFLKLQQNLCARMIYSSDVIVAMTYPSCYGNQNPHRKAIQRRRGIILTSFSFFPSMIPGET